MTGLSLLRGLGTRGPVLVHALGGGLAAIITPVHRDLDGLLGSPGRLAAVGRLGRLICLMHRAFS